MMQLNPKLKQLFKHLQHPSSSEKNFGSLAKQRLEAAEIIKKSALMETKKQGFQKAHSQKAIRRGGSQYSSTGGSRG